MLSQYGSRCGYLPEILDSAQESSDHLWVNGEKYVFSEHVVESGNDLAIKFGLVKQFVDEFYTTHFGQGEIEEDSLSAFEFDLEQLKDLLKQFDELWCIYEQKYVYELMVIEGDARRFITEAIQREMQLNETNPLDERYNTHREGILQSICEVNRIANTEGQGREDFELALMKRAETLIKSNNQEQNQYSKSVLNLSKKVKKTFNAFRVLIQRYSKNIELVDP